MGRLRSLLLLGIRSPRDAARGLRFALLRRVLGSTRLDARLVATAPRRHARLARGLASRERIPFLLLEHDVATWKCDSVYRAADEHPRLDPLVVVYPREFDDEAVHRHDRTAESFEAMGYAVRRTLDQRGRFVGSGLGRTGVIVLTNPHASIVPAAFRPELLMNHLPVYIPYMIGVYASEDLNFNQLAYHLSWRNYRATPWHFREGLRSTPESSRNARFVGYPNRDRLTAAFTAAQPRGGDPVVLWAPHHTIEASEYQVSTFLEWHERFLSLARDDASVEVVFRPHPLLKGKLGRLWGSDRTRAYWTAWQEARRGRVSEMEHQAEVFARCDAIIHDSITFAGEWLLSGRPAAFLMRADVDPRGRLNELGRQFLRGHHLVRDGEDLETFLDLVRSGRSDPLAAVQQQLAAAELPPPTAGSVGQAVVRDICAGLGIPA